MTTPTAAPRTLLALVLLAASVLIGLPVAAASAATPTLYTSDDGQYTFYCTAGSSSALLEDYLGPGGDVTIPATVTSTESGTCDVTEVGTSTYQGKGLTSVTIATQVTVYGPAFTGNAISQVSIAGPGAGATTVPAGAFADQTVGGLPVIGWLDDRDFVVDDISGSFFDDAPARFIAVTSERHTVSFDPRNGSEPVVEQQVFDGELATEPPVPADPPIDGGDAIDVELIGWFTSSGDRFDFSKPITGDLNLEARWNYIFPDSRTVTFEPENGEPATTVAVTDGGTVEQPPRPTPDPPLEPGANRVDFFGWVRSLEGDADRFDFDTPITGDITLYAVWVQRTEEQHTVTFVPNDDGSADATFSVEVLDGETVDEPAAPTPYPETDDARYEFRGWGDAAGPYDFSTPVTDDLVLTGGWTEISKTAVVTTEVTTLKLSDSVTQPGAQIDLELDLFGEIPTTTVVPVDPPFTLRLQRQNELTVSGCTTNRSVSLEGGDDCASGQPATVVSPPYTGPSVPAGNIQKLCQAFCYGSAAVSVESTPRYLGEMTLDDRGRGALTVTLPADLEPGDHTIVVDPEGGGEQIRYPITVTAGASVLPDTGAPAGGSWAETGALAVVAGTLLVLAAQRPRRRA